MRYADIMLPGSGEHRRFSEVGVFGLVTRITQHSLRILERKGLLKMSETEVHQDLATASAKPISPLMSFAIKVAIIAFAVLLVVHLTVSIVAQEIAETTLLKGGPQFWSSVEQNLYNFADAPDLPPEKKQKIVKALAKIYSKYQPYVDALNGRTSK